MHPFVKNATYVAYRHARFDPVAHLQRMVDNNYAIPQPPVSGQLLTQIRQGLFASPQTPNEIKELLAP